MVECLQLTHREFVKIPCKLDCVCVLNGRINRLSNRAKIALLFDHLEKGSPVSVAKISWSRQIDVPLPFLENASIVAVLFSKIDQQYLVKKCSNLLPLYVSQL